MTILNKGILSIPYFLLLILILNACGKKGEQQKPPKSIPAVEVTQKTITTYQNFPTTIEGTNNNDVRAKINGYILEVLVDEGQHVRQGQALFRLETNVLAPNASAAKSGITAASANIEASKANVNAARIEVDKLQPLVDKGIISNVPLETAKANLLRANGQLSQANAAYEQAQANYKSAAASVDYSIIKAPISGILGKINFRKGALVGPSDPMPITKISDTRELYAYFSMNEAEYLDFLGNIDGTSVSDKVRNLPMVELLLANESIYSEKGKITTVTGQIDPTTGSIQFRVSFPNPSGILTNGNTGEIRIPKQFNNAMIVPESALYEQQGNIFLYKIVSDSVVATKVNVTARTNNMGIINDGVKIGDKIAAQGVGTLKTGMKVKAQLTTTDSIITHLKPKF
jgi:membrane fusion protein (multidrug efflux system)